MSHFRLTDPLNDRSAQTFSPVMNFFSNARLFCTQELLFRTGDALTIVQAPGLARDSGARSLLPGPRKAARIRPVLRSRFPIAR
jgi:hypothetical protein